MRLLTAGSSVRAGLQEPINADDHAVYQLFLYLKEQLNMVNIYICLHMSVNRKTAVQCSVHAKSLYCVKPRKLLI